MIELLKCKCADQKNRILRRGGLAATTVKFSTNGLPKLRSGLLLERKKDRLIAAYSLHCGRFSHRFASARRSSLAGGERLTL